MIVAWLSHPLLYSVSVFQKPHLPSLMWSLNPVIVLLPLKDAVILNSLSLVSSLPCQGTNKEGGELGNLVCFITMR